MGMTLNDGLIPSATEAIGMALGPGRAHDRRAGTDGTDNRAPVEETGRETKSFAVDGRFSILRSVTKSPPQSIQRGVWPRVHCLQTRVQRRQESRQLLIRRHPNHLQHHIHSRRKNTLTPRSGHHKYAKFPTEVRKRHAVTHFKSMQLSVALLRVNPVEVPDQQTQHEGESLRPRCSSCHGS